MKKAYIFLIVLFFSFSSLYGEELKPHIIEARRIARILINDPLINDQKLRFLGWSGAMFSCIEELDFSFETKNILDLDASRIQIVRLTEKFLQVINNDTNLNNYLKSYPFKPKNLIITIYYINNTDLEDDQSFSQAFLKNGTIYYFSNYKKKCLKNESYEEAKELVNSQINSVSAFEMIK